MGSRSALLFAAAAVALVAAATALLPGTASAATYKVGGKSGWDTGVDYNAWATSKTFKVGDTLEFLYPAGIRGVVLVDAQSYSACTVPDNNAPSLNSGDDKVALTRTGWWYFICDVEGECDSGLKLAVYVVA